MPVTHFKEVKTGSCLLQCYIISAFNSTRTELGALIVEVLEVKYFKICYWYMTATVVGHWCHILRFIMCNLSGQQGRQSSAHTLLLRRQAVAKCSECGLALSYRNNHQCIWKRPSRSLCSKTFLCFSICMYKLSMP